MFLFVSRILHLASFPFSFLVCLNFFLQTAPCRLPLHSLSKLLSLLVKFVGVKEGDTRIRIWSLQKQYLLHSKIVFLLLSVFKKVCPFPALAKFYHQPLHSLHPPHNFAQGTVNPSTISLDWCCHWLWHSLCCCHCCHCHWEGAMSLLFLLSSLSSFSLSFSLLLSLLLSLSLSLSCHHHFHYHCYQMMSPWWAKGGSRRGGCHDVSAISSSHPSYHCNKKPARQSKSSTKLPMVQLFLSNYESVSSKEGFP